MRIGVGADRGQETTERGEKEEIQKCYQVASEVQLSWFHLFTSSHHHSYCFASGPTGAALSKEGPDGGAGWTVSPETPMFFSF